MKMYNATYSANGIFVSVAQFNANNLKEAKSFAQFHKKMTPEIRRAGNVKTEVKYNSKKK